MTTVPAAKGSGRRPTAEKNSADRPYGRFPGSGMEAAALVEPSAEPSRLRDRIRGTGRIRRIRIALASGALLLVVAGTIGASQPRQRTVAARPTPGP
ncbi:MAG: hypothetical protein HYU87_07875, partial [Chloroflexi bacterium]|nr:hypothetical protein [Chloroflexota bacterium]